MGESPDTHISERRCFPRFPCTGSAEILEGGMCKWWGNVSDISQGGCYIELQHPLSPGSERQLRITIASTVIEVTARVVIATQMVGMGMKFVEISPAQERNLAQVIEHYKNPASTPPSLPDGEIPKANKPHQQAALAHLQRALAELREAMRVPEERCENALHWTENAIHEITGLHEKTRPAGRAQ